MPSTDRPFLRPTRHRDERRPHAAPDRHAPSPARRSFLRLAGGGVVLAATAPLAACSAGYPAAAVAPWQQADTEQELRRFMLAHALLAPNPHNRQPWIADLREPGRIHLACDATRLLPETDPHGRQILIGCGAFIELAVIAAAQRGVAVEVLPFPAGEPAATGLPGGRRIATLRLGAPGSVAADPLFAQIRRRHTAKTAYEEGRALPVALAAQWQATAQALGLQAGLVTGGEKLQALRRLARRGYEIECMTDRTWLESARLMRIGPREIETHRDGISLNSPKVRAVHAVGLFDPMTVPKPGSSEWQRVLDRFLPFETGSGFLWLAGRDASRTTQLASGRAYVRAHLQATAAGVDMHPLSQVLQEFEEMREPYLAVHRELGANPARAPVQMLARVGFSTVPPAPTPRRELDTLLVA